MANQRDSSARAVIRISTSGSAKQGASVIHTSRQLTGREFLKLPTKVSDSEFIGSGSDEPDNVRRREILARRPSYRKLFNDLTGDQQTYVVRKIEDDSSDGHMTQGSNDNSNDTAIDFSGMSGQTFRIVSQDDGSESGLQTLTVGGNIPTSGTTAVIQYTQGPDGGQYFIPVQQLSPSGVMSFPQGIMVAATGGGHDGGHQVLEEASRKRELRLLKNKEAAKECRRKKKEYVKCLENRVAVLENQNKTLIEELKSLKELYCQKEVHS